jgi:transcriptional regulator with GAF, ATPase, and Fis domain
MKRHTIESAADAVRGIFRAFEYEDRVKIFVQAMRTADTNTDDTKRAEIEEALNLGNGSTRRAAKLLGYSQRTLQNRMRRLNMPPGRDGRPPLATSNT